MNNDQLKGLLEEVIGRFKEVAGKIVNDKKMELEGNLQRMLVRLRQSGGMSKKL